MAVGMLDKLTNYLMPMEEKPVKKQRAPENESDYGVKPVNLQVHTNQGVALKIVVVSPGKYDDVRMYADYLKANIAIVINLTGVEVDMQHAIKDFMNGVSYILAGNVQRVADSVFMYTPGAVGIDKELYAYSVPTYVKPRSE